MFCAVCTVCVGVGGCMCARAGGHTHLYVPAHPAVWMDVIPYFSLLAIRWICESHMSMNSSTEILDLIRGGWVNCGGRGVALSLSYCSSCFLLLSSFFYFIQWHLNKYQSSLSPLSERIIIIFLSSISCFIVF